MSPYAIVAAGLLVIGFAVGFMFGDGAGYRRCDRMWFRESQAWKLNLSRSTWAANLTRPVPAAAQSRQVVAAQVTAHQRAALLTSRHGSAEVSTVPLSYQPRHAKNSGEITQEFERIVGTEWAVAA